MSPDPHRLPLGTLPWAERSRGRLGPGERIRFLSQAVRFQAGALPEQVQLAFGFRGSKGAAMNLDEIGVPDSALAREAEGRADALPAYLTAHSHRTYLWAAALAGLEGQSFDREVLYVGALLHDTGLAGEVVSSECFTLAGARAAEDAVGATGSAPEQGRAAAEAIALHINPIVGGELGIEARLLAAGAAFDVVGRRYRALDPGTVGAVLSRHPRHGFKRSFRAAWQAHGRAFPQGRAHALSRFGFGLAIRMAPFDE